MCHRFMAFVAALGLWLALAEVARASEITVTTAADQNGGNAAECSLREAIQAAILNAIVDGCPAGQAAPTVDVIKFAIPGGGAKTITIDSSQLDELLEPVVIDGWSQGGNGYTGPPLIELRRGTAPYGTYALRVRGNGGGSTIRGLAISNWSQRTAAAENPGRGIQVDGANNVTIQGNYFGLRPDGSEGGGNATDLTIINGSQNTQVGGSTAGARNVFSGFSAFVNPDSISISGATTAGTRIQGNYFGLSVDGTSAIQGASITFSSAGQVTIGGSNPGERNYINVSLVEFGSSGAAHQIIGNYFGVNANGADLPSAPGLTIGGGGTVVRNNVLHSATVGGAATVIQGNLIGLAPDGTTILGGATGLSVSSDGSLVGGTTAPERNVIAGSSGFGLTLTGNNQTVYGNFIGTDVTGQSARPNANGASLSGTGLVFGGPSAGQRNVVSGNTGNGIRITGNGHTIAGNLVGVAADGTSALGNGSNGIIFNSNDSNPVMIGGTTTGAGNTIANNAAAGIRNDFSSRVRVTMLGNSISSNGTLGIQLGFSSSPRANDANDGDTGPNNGQNYPVLASAVVGSGTTIAGTLNSTPGTNGYRIELFSSPTCDGTGNGEGRTFLGSTTVSTDGAGNGAFSLTVPAALTVGSQVTATATDPLGSTSEFSQCLAVAGGTTPPPPPPSSCSPRPAVQVVSTRGAAGMLNVTVQAGAGSISRIDFGAPRALNNASISVANGPANQSQGFTFTPASGETTAQFVVTSENRGAPTTVPFTVIDGCGSWPTFVGGGAGAF
jgi:CSLREA domain-containing protein